MSDVSVYRIRWEDVNRFQALLYDLPEIPRELRVFDGRPKSEWWEPVPVYSDAPRLEVPTFWHLIGVATIVVTPDIATEFERFFVPAGELLPLRLSGTGIEFFALNILNDVDCLNPAAYDLDDLELYTDFLEHRLPESGLFKIPQVDEVEIFYLERLGDEHSFKDLVEENGYRGITFEPVWSNDGSIRPVNILAMM